MKHLVTLFFAFFFTVSMGQNLQDVPYFRENQIFTNRATSNLAKGGDEIQQVPLKFHVLRDGPVWFDDTTLVDNLIDTINIHFLPANIEFVKCESVNYINNSEYANGWDPSTIIFNVQEEHIQENVINVFIANTTTIFDGFSFSSAVNQWQYGVQFNAVLISGESLLNSKPYLLTHELGHYFGLYHPSDNTGSLELVDGSNCNEAGDFCCDTPAEYSGMCCANIEVCEYVPLFGDFIDANGDTLLNPDVKNYMTIMQYNINCPSRFTDDQYARIQYFHENYLSELSCTATVGIETFDYQKIVLAPNPANEKLIIQSDEALRDFQFTIYNTNGISVYDARATNEIDISDFANGVYFLTISNGNELSRSLKFVKR